MALKRISVVVLICVLSFADAEICADEDEKLARQACDRKELCITINGKNRESYTYSEKMNITVECHYNGARRKELDFLRPEDFTIKWKEKNTEGIIEDTKCRNLKTVIQLSPNTSKVLYTCEKHDDSSSNMTKDIEFIYVRNESIPRTTSKPTLRPTPKPTPTPTPRPRQTTIRPSSKPPTIDGEYSATIKVKINGGTIGEVKSTTTSVGKNDLGEADYYYFDHEMVNVTCALVISDPNPKSYLLAAHSNETCIHGNNNAQISHTQELTASVAALNYQCDLKIGDKAEGETCVKTERRALFNLKLMFAKLMMYINNEVKEEETTENGREIVYTYNQEDITIKINCSHADRVYNHRHIAHPAIIWDTKQLGSTYKNNSNTYIKNNSNTIQMPLFADQSNSYLDCVEQLENQVSFKKEYQPTRIRLRFIYAKLRMYIDNNNVTEEHKTANGIEVVYKYKKENVTVFVNCSHGAEVYRIPRYNMSHTPIKWITEKLDSTYNNKKKNTTIIKKNSIQIRLFADQNESFLDCVDNLSVTSAENSKIRLKFIYETDAELISLSDPKDDGPNKDRYKKDADLKVRLNQKDAEAMSMCDPEDSERAQMQCGKKELCITIDNKIVTSYNYSQEMDISVICHYNGRDSALLKEHVKDNFTIHWKNGGDVISNEEKCRNLKKVIHLSPDINKTVYTCEKYSTHEFVNITENITFLYVPQENLILNEGFFTSNWILLAAGLVLFIVVIAVIVAIWVLLKSRKSSKEDKKCLNPRGSRESLEDIPKDTNSEPTLNEQYTDLNADTASEVYSNPYTAMYTQPIPKNVRKTKVFPKLPPKPKPRNVENYLNTSGLVYEEPSTYNNINSNTRRIAENTGATYNDIDKCSKNTGATYNNIGKSSKNTGATYNNIGKSSKNTGATYNNIGKSSKHTGATYNNIGKSSKHTGTIYNNIDKSSKNPRRVNFYDNMAASYSNTDNENCSSDVYSEPGLYEEPS